MDFDFYNKWEQIGTVKIGNPLIKKIVQLDSINKMNIIESIFPSGHPAEGETLELYVLDEKRYQLAKNISEILSDECQKALIESQKNSIETKDSEEFNNPQVLVKLLSLLLDPNTTHFALG